MKKFTFICLLFLITPLSYRIFADADEPAGTRKSPAIISAIYARNFRRVAWLVRRGHSVNTFHVGMPALHHAITMSDLRIIRFLVYKGANLRAKNSSGQTALQFAKQIGNRAVIRFLRGRGAR